MKVRIVDNPEHVRDSSAKLCEQKENVETVGEAARGEAALDSVEQLNPMTTVTMERFARSMSRVRHQLNLALFDNAGSTPKLPGVGHAGLVSTRYLVGERQRRLYPLDPQMIDYIEADGNWVTLRCGKTEYLCRDSLKRLSKLLEDVGFIRIERSLLVNAAAVTYAEVSGNGTFALTLRSGVCLHSSAAYRDCIFRVIPLPRRYRDSAS